MKAKKKSVIIIMTVAIVFVVFAIGMGICKLAYMAFGGNSPIEEYMDITDYNKYMGKNAIEDFRSKFGMDESIFPQKITDDMNVLDYRMVYYNPWDAQYLSYLTVSYTEESYLQEVNRLEQYDSTEYLGYYGVTGFDNKYELLAMYADSYYGFVYALTDGTNEITYVEIIFCNYFMDIDYEKYIDVQYLPDGFDATLNNAYRKEMLTGK